MKKWPGYVADSGRMRFQRRIPEEVRHAFGGRDFIRFPLSGTEREAKRSALAWYVTYEEVFAEIRGQGRALPAASSAAARPLSAYTPEEMRSLVEPVADAADRHQHASIANGAASFDALVTSHEKLNRAVRDVLSGKGSDYLGILSAIFLASRGIPCDTRESLSRFVFEHARVLLARTVKPGARRLDGEDVEPEPEPAPPPIGAGLMIPVPEHSGSSAGLTLGTVVGHYLKALPPNHYRRKLDTCITLFRELIGANLPVRGLTQIHVRDFLLSVCTLPSDWATRYRQQGASLDELLADADAERLSQTTYEASYRATLGKFLRDALRDYGAEGFPGLSVDYPYTGTRTGVQDKQRHLEEGELRRLFEGREFAAVAADPSRAHLYWLSVIGLFTGARPREVCQLNPQCDWGQAEGVWYLTFDEGTPAGVKVRKTIKTGERRLVPLHPELVRLGLPEFLQQLKDAGADRMFPASRIKQGNPYTVMGDEFTELLKATGLYDNKTVGAMVLGYYVLRKTFITYGDEQHIDVAPFVGHREAGKTVTDKHYITRPKRVPWLYEAFKGLTYPVNIPLSALPQSPY